MTIRQLNTTPTAPTLSQISPLQLISCTPDCTSNNYNGTQKVEYLCQDTGSAVKYLFLLYSVSVRFYKLHTNDFLTSHKLWASRKCGPCCSSTRSITPVNMDLQTLDSCVRLMSTLAPIEIETLPYTVNVCTQLDAFSCSRTYTYM